MRLEGSLDAFSLPDIFALLSMTKKTGGLHLRRDADHGVVWFSSGSLTGGSPAVERHSLLRRVVAVADVAPDALRAAVDLARSEDLGVVTALLRLEAVDEGRLHEVAGEHIVDTVFSLLRWDNGDFEFVVDEADRDAVGIERTVDEVVAEARRRLEEWNALGDSVPAPDRILRVAGTVADTVTLEPHQWSLLALADGRRSVAEIVDLSGRGDYAAVRSLADLMRTGVLCEVSADDSSVAARLGILAELEGIPAPRSAREDDVAPQPVDGVADGAQPEAESTPEPEWQSADSVAADEPDGATSAEEAAPADEAAPVDAPDAEAEEVHAADDSGHGDAEQPDAAELGGVAAAVDGETPEDPNPADEPTAAAGNDDTDGDEPAAPTPFRPAGRDLSRVTPQRPEPFLPSRPPAHPDTAMPSTVGALAAATAPASHIERDPSVNKSLLLRLIAGVRGL